MVDIFKMPDIRPVYVDQVLVVPIKVNFDPLGRWTSWVLPGGISTLDFDVVRDYVMWVKREQLHVKGMKGLEVA